MGEIAAILASGLVKNAKLQIELNDPTTTGGSQTIHIQSNTMRFEMTIHEFRALAASIIDGNVALTSYKTDQK